MLTSWRRLCRILYPRPSKSSAELVRWARDVADDDDDDTDRSSTAASCTEASCSEHCADNEPFPAPAAAGDDGRFCVSTAARKTRRQRILRKGHIGGAPDPKISSFPAAIQAITETIWFLGHTQVLILNLFGFFGDSRLRHTHKYRKIHRHADYTTCVTTGRILCFAGQP